MSARSKNLWTLLGAAVVAAALGLYAYFGVMRQDEREQEKKLAAERLVQPVSRPDGGTELVRYDRLLVKANGDTTELGRLPDQSWVINRPLKAAATVRTAEDIIGTLQYSRVKGTVEEHPSPEDLKRFGLAPPAVEVTASADGVPPLTLRIGAANPFNDTVYVQREGDPKVYAMDRVARTSLEQGTFDLRDKEVVGVRDLGVTRIDVHGRKHSWTVARAPGQPYGFSRPAAEPADTAAISAWLSELHGFKATHFIDDSPAERKRTGVEKPEVEAVFERGTTETVHVRVAGGKTDSGPAYVLREDQFGVTLAEVPRGAIATLDKSPAELRERNVVRVKPEDVARIRLSSGDGALVLERERPVDGGPESWHLRSPREALADGFKVSSLLYALTSLRAEATDEKLPTDPGKTGLGPGARTVTLEGSTGNALAKLVVGGTSSKPAGTFVRDDRGQVVIVPQDRIKALPRRAEDLLPAAPPVVDADAGI
ncbi:MAG TPA: DUF4340 domain-containing protein [Myxococcaceae bacterium]|nr:DUF4340 domain-containing protein [Myxococcaceae bacterium]